MQVLKESIRKGILFESKKLFLKKEYHEVRMRDISKKVGISVGTIYHYYPSKRALLEALLETPEGPVSASPNDALKYPQEWLIKVRSSHAAKFVFIKKMIEREMVPNYVAYATCHGMMEMVKQNKSIFALGSFYSRMSEMTELDV